MSDFSSSWTLSRKRFVDEISGLSAAQLNWRIHPGCLTIGEMALHLAGVEVSFASQLTGHDPGDPGSRIRLAATEGVVNDNPFPYSAEEIGPQTVAESLEIGRSLLEPIIAAADPAIRRKEIKSALGPMIDGEGAFARLGFHSAYHQGQAYLIDRPRVPCTLDCYKEPGGTVPEPHNRRLKAGLGAPASCRTRLNSA